MENKSAAARIQDLPVELLEKIFLYLSCHDLLRAQEVERCWRECITGTQSLQKIMWKQPVFSKNEDPHFFNDSLAYSKIYTDPETGMKTESELFPLGRRVPYCQVCDTCHNTFIHGNLHPFLRDLLGRYSCISGHGSRLYLCICIDHLSSEYLSRHLGNAYRKLLSKNATGDMLTKPISKRLSLSLFDASDKHTNFPLRYSHSEGLKAGDVLKVIAQNFQVFINQRRWLYSNLLAGGNLSEEERRETQEQLQIDTESLENLKVFGLDDHRLIADGSD